MFVYLIFFLAIHGFNYIFTHSSVSFGCQSLVTVNWLSTYDEFRIYGVTPPIRFFTFFVIAFKI